EGRRQESEVPNLIVNPRATVPYGEDSVRFYLEAYEFAPGDQVTAAKEDGAGTTLWRDTVSFTGDRQLASAEIAVPPGQLAVGRLDLIVRGISDRDAMARSPLLVSLSEEWVIANLAQ